MRFLCALAVFAIALALPALALGHAELVSSDPPAGGTLTSTPYTLTATFDDELTPDGSSIVIENASGAQVAQGTVSADDAHVQIAELPVLPDGVYTVRWTSVSADDAAVERGSYTFTIGAGSSATATPTPAPDGGATGSSNDVLIAVGLAAIIIVVVVGYVFLRGRR